MTGNPCLILEWSAAGDWPRLYANGDGLERWPLRIPADARPTVLQPDRASAEAEARRLAELHHGKCFAVFEAQAVATAVELPTHVTVSGCVWASRMVGTLIDIDDPDSDDIPF